MSTQQQPSLQHKLTTITHKDDLYRLDLFEFPSAIKEKAATENVGVVGQAVIVVPEDHGRIEHKYLGNGLDYTTFVKHDKKDYLLGTIVKVYSDKPTRVDVQLDKANDGGGDYDKDTDHAPGVCVLYMYIMGLSSFSAEDEVKEHQQQISVPVDRIRPRHSAIRKVDNVVLYPLLGLALVTFRDPTHAKHFAVIEVPTRYPKQAPRWIHGPLRVPEGPMCNHGVGPHRRETYPVEFDHLLIDEDHMVGVPLRTIWDRHHMRWWNLKTGEIHELKFPMIKADEKQDWSKHPAQVRHMTHVRPPRYDVDDGNTTTYYLLATNGLVLEWYEVKQWHSPTHGHGHGRGHHDDDETKQQQQHQKKKDDIFVTGDIKSHVKGEVKGEVKGDIKTSSSSSAPTSTPTPPPTMHVRYVGHVLLIPEEDYKTWFDDATQERMKFSYALRFMTPSLECSLGRAYVFANQFSTLLEVDLNDTTIRRRFPLGLPKTLPGIPARSICMPGSPNCPPVPDAVLIRDVYTGQLLIARQYNQCVRSEIRKALENVADPVVAMDHRNKTKTTRTKGKRQRQQKQQGRTEHKGDTKGDAKTSQDIKTTPEQAAWWRATETALRQTLDTFELMSDSDKAVLLSPQAVVQRKQRVCDVINEHMHVVSSSFKIETKLSKFRVRQDGPEEDVWLVMASSSTSSTWRNTPPVVLGGVVLRASHIRAVQCDHKAEEFLIEQLKQEDHLWLDHVYSGGGQGSTLSIKSLDLAEEWQSTIKPAYDKKLPNVTRVNHMMSCLDQNARFREAITTYMVKYAKTTFRERLILAILKPLDSSYEKPNRITESWDVKDYYHVDPLQDDPERVLTRVWYECKLDLVNWSGDYCHVRTRSDDQGSIHGDTYRMQIREKVAIVDDAADEDGNETDETDQGDVKKQEEKKSTTTAVATTTRYAYIDAYGREREECQTNKVTHCLYVAKPGWPWEWTSCSLTHRPVGKYELQALPFCDRDNWNKILAYLPSKHGISSGSPCWLSAQDDYQQERNRHKPLYTDYLHLVTSTMREKGESPLEIPLRVIQEHGAGFRNFSSFSHAASSNDMRTLVLWDNDYLLFVRLT